MCVHQRRLSIVKSGMYDVSFIDLFIPANLEYHPIEHPEKSRFAQWYMQGERGVDPQDRRRKEHRSTQYAEYSPNMRTHFFQLLSFDIMLQHNRFAAIYFSVSSQLVDGPFGPQPQRRERTNLTKFALHFPISY